jgi:hypothetical protein
MAAEFFAGAWGDHMTGFKESLGGFLQGYTGGKPVVLAIQSEGFLCHTEHCAQELREAGFTVFLSLSRACRALRRFAGYHTFLAGQGVRSGGGSDGGR